MSNYKKLVSNIIRYYPRDRDGRQTLSDAYQELNLIRDRFGVRITPNRLSWTTKQIKIGDYNLGRFDLIYQVNNDCLCFLYPRWKNKKHPHSTYSNSNWGGITTKTKFYAYTCMGSLPMKCIQDLRFFDLYKCTDIILSNIRLDDAQTMTNYKRGNILDLCANYGKFECTNCGRFTDSMGICASQYCLHLLTSDQLAHVRKCDDDEDYYEDDDDEDDYDDEWDD